MRDSRAGAALPALRLPCHWTRGRAGRENLLLRQLRAGRGQNATERSRLIARAGSALFRRGFGRRCLVRVPASVTHPATMARFHVFQALLLLRREIRRDLAVCFGNRLADSVAGVASNFFELGPRFLNDRRNLGHLLVRQSKLPL